MLKYLLLLIYIFITKEQLSFIQILLPIVADYGIYHPTKYIWARSELYWWQISDCPKSIISYAQKAQYNLVSGFRSWIGPNQKLAINRENSTEYTWEDVIVFDELVKPELREMLVAALINTAVVRESIFLFYDHRFLAQNMLLFHQLSPKKLVKDTTNYYVFFLDTIYSE